MPLLRNPATAMRGAAQWPWVLSGALTACAVLLSYGLIGHVSAPNVDWLPDRGKAAPSADDPGAWETRPDTPVGGWLPESRWESRPFFDVRRCSVRVEQILDMAPGVDDVPSLDEPRFVAPQMAGLQDTDEVLGLKVRTAARCYPLNVLKWHNVVNDVLEGEPVAVVFDPLCGGVLAFSRVVDGTLRTFGVPGKAYNGAALLYDRETRALWCPLRGECISGPGAGRTRLDPMGVERTTWGQWRQRHPGTLVLSRQTGYGRPYDLDPYAQAPGPGGRSVNYWAADSPMLAPAATAPDTRDIPAKTEVLGIRPAQRERPVAFIPPRQAMGPVPLVFPGESRPCGTYGAQGFSLGEDEPRRAWQVECFWYSWVAAYPDTVIVRVGS
jgi:hypothetical protein